MKKLNSIDSSADPGNKKKLLELALWFAIFSLAMIATMFVVHVEVTSGLKKDHLHHEQGIVNIDSTPSFSADQKNTSILK